MLTAIGVPHELAAASVRFSLGYASTAADVDHALAVLPQVIARLRGSEAAPAQAG